MGLAVGGASELSHGLFLDRPPPKSYIVGDSDSQLVGERECSVLAAEHHHY